MKIRNYWTKKYNPQRRFAKSNLRKQVADKRLRIGGRFVTKSQAFEILGIDQQDLLENDSIQELLSKKHDRQKRFNSQIKDERKGGKVVRV